MAGGRRDFLARRNRSPPQTHPARFDDMNKRFQIGLLVCGALAASGLGTTASAQEAAGPYRYTAGKDIYEHICQGCHMPDAKGAVGAGAYPALAANPRLETGMYPVM